jgi:adenylate kinase
MKHQPWQAAIVMGLPGTGKSTMCRALEPTPSLVHVEAGEVLRRLDPDSPAGRRAQPYIDRGDLVPDELTMQAWAEHVEKLVDNGSFVPERQVLLLDGIPRTLVQGKSLRDRAEVRGLIFLDVDDDDVLVHRLLKRGETSGRSDDAGETVIRKRIAMHRADVLPVLELYPETIRRRIDAGREPLAVLADVAGAASELLE